MVLVRVSKFKWCEGLPWSMVFIGPTFFDGMRDLVAYAHLQNRECPVWASCGHRLSYLIRVRFMKRVFQDATVSWRAIRLSSHLAIAAWGANVTRHRERKFPKLGAIVISHESASEVVMTQQVAGLSAVIRRLQDQCNGTLDQSLQGVNEAQLGESYLFAGDLDAWRKAIDGELEVSIVETAANEYVLAILNVCQGQYRNAFKGLRLVLELCLQSTYLSANLVLRAEWLKGEQDTIWATLIDADKGPLSARACRAFSLTCWNMSSISGG